MGLYHPEGP